MDNTSDNTKNLSGNKAIEKMRDFAKDENCLFCTYHSGTKITARPMRTQDVDDDGCLWFFSAKSSNKNQEVAKNDNVYLMYGNPGKENYLYVEGTAEIIDDQQLIDKYWSAFIKAWFNEGKEDPEITLIKVTPGEAYYWDTKHGKMIAFFKVMVSAIAGKTMDDSLEGKLKI